MRTQKTDFDKLKKFLKSNRFAYRDGPSNGITGCIVIEINDDGSIDRYEKPKPDPAQKAEPARRNRN